MNNCASIDICDVEQFDKICQSAQDRWEDIERSYRDYNGDVIDGDEYNDLYVLRLQWILEGVFPKSHPLIEHFNGYEPLAKFLIEESDEWEPGYSMFYIEYESADLYDTLCKLVSECG